MESGGFFNAEMLSDGSYDMNYVAEQFAQYFALFVGNGIFVDDVNNLQASSAGGMNVKFNKGAAFWDGYWYINSESLAKVVDINLDASARIDSFVVRFDIAGRKNSIEYKKGDTSVQRADGVYELQLCTIRVDAGSTSITDSNITDTRTNENVCGFVKGLLEVVQTDDLFKQFSSMFNTWFDKIKGVLDGDTAGNILGMIGLLDDLQTDDKSSVVAAINEVKQKNDEQTLDIEKLNEKLSWGTNVHEAYSIEQALARILDTDFVGYDGFIDIAFLCASGWYNMMGRRSSDCSGTGIVHKLYEVNETYTFSRTAGADAVLKKLASPEIRTKTVTNASGNFNAGGTVLFAAIQTVAWKISTYAEKYGHSSAPTAYVSHSGRTISYYIGQQSGVDNDVSRQSNYSMTIIYAIE